MSISRQRARFVLASFVAAVLVTLLAPFVHTTTWELVCSANGNRLVATHDGGAHAATPAEPDDEHAMHCPLCMPAGAPPSTIVADFTPVQPLAFVLASIPAARLASLVGAPLPARGPPSAS